MHTEAEKQLGMKISSTLFPLMKRFYRKLSKQVISFFKTSNLKQKLVINNLNTLPMSIKKFLT